jgi:hypothetical protein
MYLYRLQIKCDYKKKIVVRGVSHGERGGTPKAVNLSFLDWNRYFSFQVAPQFSS